MKDKFTYKVVFWSIIGMIIMIVWMVFTSKVIHHADEIDELFEPKVEQYESVWRGTVADTTTVKN